EAPVDTKLISAPVSNKIEAQRLFRKGTGAGQKATCFERRAHGHFKRECPKLKNNNRGNSVGNGNAPAKVYAVGHAGTNPDFNVVMGADRSFVTCPSALSKQPLCFYLI
ncbi:putative reverse transcriptase domain-containing protein, partial [Tanacetum coccineum]